MKNKIVVSLLVVVLLALTVMSTGCFFDQQGKTAGEVNRDHMRTLRVNQEQLMSDIDEALFLDKPSSLSEKQLP